MSCHQWLHVLILRQDDSLDEATGLRFPGLVLGDVLVARSPCVLASDFQKIKAVFKDELVNYENVLVCSSKGKMPLLGKLSGG